MNSELAIVAAQQTPAYSNNAFSLLAFALEKVTGESMEQMYRETIIDQLNLKHIFYTSPPDPALEPYHTTQQRLAGVRILTYSLRKYNFSKIQRLVLIS